jgi:hypothetical protein
MRCRRARAYRSPVGSQALQKNYQRLLGSVPTRRLNPALLTDSPFFQNKLVRGRVHAARAFCSA